MKFWKSDANKTDKSTTDVMATKIDMPTKIDTLIKEGRTLHYQYTKTCGYFIESQHPQGTGGYQRDSILGMLQFVPDFVSNGNCSRVDNTLMMLFKNGEYTVLGTKFFLVNVGHKIYLHFNERKDAVKLTEDLKKLVPKKVVHDKVFQLVPSYGWTNVKDQKYKTCSDQQLIGYEDYVARVSKDIENMVKHNAFLTSLGEAHSLNYLLFGPPGVGKTTFVKHLATKYELPVYVVRGGDLSSFSADYILNPCEQLCILLFEDFDRYLENYHQQMKMADILNAVDGVAHSRPIVRIFTGNDCNVIFNNQALLTRMSNKFQFFYPTLTHYETKLRKFLTYYKDEEIDQTVLKTLLQKIDEIIVPAHVSLRSFSSFVARYFNDENFLQKMTDNLNELTVDYTKLSFEVPESRKCKLDEDKKENENKKDNPYENKKDKTTRPAIEFAGHVDIGPDEIVDDDRAQQAEQLERAYQADKLLNEFLNSN